MGLCFAGALLGQSARPLGMNRSGYTVVAGERVSLEAPAESLAFMKSAKTRIALAADRTFPVAPNTQGDQILLGVPLTTRPGDYRLTLSFLDDAGQQRTAAVQVTVKPFATAASGSAVPPVVLLDGWQLPSATSACPMSSDSSGTFGNLQNYLLGSPNFVPAVFFFENCTECPNCTIEQLGADLGSFLNSIQYADGTPVPQIDVVAHSMGGLIVRSYLSGKETTSGAFSPPLSPKIRKAVFIGTPHFGSFQADSLLADVVFGLGNQTNEMKRGSQFLWNLATWNQNGDDLRGTDAIAVIGDAGGFENLSNASDGVVALSSGSLDFVMPGRTRIIDYCHIPLTAGSLEADYLGCAGGGIAYIDTPDHPTYRIVSSFLQGGTSWETVGNSPSQDPYLSKYGGLVVADINANDQYVAPSAVSWGNLGLSEGAAGYLYYTDLVSGTGNFDFGSSTCGPYTESAGLYSAVRCKSAPSIYSVGPLIPGPGKVVQSGSSITISGTGFGAEQCASCSVAAANPQPTTLQVLSWSNTSITALLPAGFLGIATIEVAAPTGVDAINIMAGAVATPPDIALSSNALNFTYTIGGSLPAPQSVQVTNTSSEVLSYSVSSTAAWLTASLAGSTITASVNTAGLTPNTYGGAIAVTAAGAANSPQTISVSLTVAGSLPSVTITRVTNSATGLAGPIAPGELVSIFGSGLGPNAGVQFSVDPVTGKVDTSLAGTQVFFGSIAAPITYSSATQINAVVPYEIAGLAEITVQVQYQGGSASQTVQVAATSPGAYTLDSSGSGPVVAANQDGTINGPSNPAAKGSYVTIYFTGGGLTSPAATTGSVTGGALQWLTQPISVAVGNQPAVVSFDGSAPGFVSGVDQLNIQLSPDTPSGAQPVVITIGGVSSPSSVTLATQ